MTEIDEKTLEYIQKADKIDLLNALQERQLANIIRSYKGGKRRENAIAELVSHNLKLVVKEAFRYSKGTGLEVADFIGAGNVGLMKAAERFNPKKFKTRFSTYATCWIREAMGDLVYKNMSIVTIPPSISNGVSKLKRLIESNSTITNRAIKRRLKISENGLQRIKSANIKTISLNADAQHFKSEDGNVEFGDTIKDENAADPSKITGDRDDYALLMEAMDELDIKSRDIIRSQFLLGKKMQLRKIGRTYNVCGEDIRQLRDKALCLLRKKIEWKRKIGR